MTATINEKNFPGFAWTVVSGERDAVFSALGEHVRDDIAHVTAEMLEVKDLRARCLADPRLGDQRAAVAAASRRVYPRVWSELMALSQGSGVEFDDLVLLNLRGDLGPMDDAGPDEGCSTVGWSSGGRALMAHNEDHVPALSGRCRLLTLRIIGEPAVTVWWYPGFVPANTFGMNSAGLACAIDHIDVVRPAVAPGRYFIARALYGCADLARAVTLLTTRASAGGFAFTLGSTTETGIWVVETAAGRSRAVSCPDDTGEFTAHQNHLRWLGRGLDAPAHESLERELIFTRATVPAVVSDAWLLGLLGTPKPDGVCRNATADDPLLTLATFLVDLTAGAVTLVPRGAGRLEFASDEFADGTPAK